MSIQMLYLKSLHISVIIYMYVGTVASENNSCLIDNHQVYEWTVDTFPNPRVDINKCGRNCTKSWICDPNHIINPKQADYLDQQIEVLRQIGRCSCSSSCYIDDAPGFTISIALLAKIKSDGRGEVSKAMAKTMAQQLRQKWNFQKCDDDVIILLSRDDRKVFTDVGRGVEGILSPACIQAIYLSTKSQLGSGRFANGLDDMIQKYRYVLETRNCDNYQREASIYSHREEMKEDEETNWIAILSAMGGFIFLVLLCKLCQCCRGGGASGSSGGGGGGGGKGRAIKYHSGGLRRHSSISSFSSSCRGGSFRGSGSCGGGSIGSCGGNFGGDGGDNDGGGSF